MLNFESIVTREARDAVSGGGGRSGGSQDKGGRLTVLTCVDGPVDVAWFEKFPHHHQEGGMHQVGGVLKGRGCDRRLAGDGAKAVCHDFGNFW